MADSIATYLQDLRDIRSSGAAVKETSYYGALSNLFNEIGKTLKPKVRCIINLANRGAGLPDGGLFTLDQFQRRQRGGTAPWSIAGPRRHRNQGHRRKRPHHRRRRTGGTLLAAVWTGARD